VSSKPPRDAFRGLHVLADDDPRWPRGPVEQAEAASRGGAAVVQLRAKHATDREIEAWGQAIRQCTRESGTRFVVNDRFDLALLLDADGVHLGQDDLPPSALPAEARSALAVGRSTHDLAQARQALTEDVDYLAFGPLFGTQSKDTGYAARGLDALQQIAALASDRPVVAIGGIDASNAGSAARFGAGGIAVISAVVAADDPVTATQQIVDSFARGGNA